MVDVADDEVIKKGRLMPGNIFLVDFDEHRIIEDKEVCGQGCPASLATSPAHLPAGPQTCLIPPN